MDNRYADDRIDDEVARTLDDEWLWGDVGGRFSCLEIEALAVVLSATVGQSAGIRAIIGHALDPSEDCGDLHHGRVNTRERLVELGFDQIDESLERAGEWPACDCGEDDPDDTETPDAA